MRSTPIWRIASLGNGNPTMDESPARDTKSLVFWALSANVLVAASKLVISFITNSSSVLAESVHSLVDSLNQFMLLYGMKRSRKEPTVMHPFGYARESYFWAFMVAVMLFTLGGFFSVYKGVQKLTTPGAQIEQWLLAYAVLGISAIFEGMSFHKALQVVRKKRKTLSTFTFLKRCKEPELIVVFLEDLMAQIGIGIALVGVGLSHFTGSHIYDAMATIAIGLLLGCMAVFLTLEVRSLMVGEKASQLDEYKIRRAIRESNTVEEIIKLSTQHLGPEEIMVAMSCKFPDYYNYQEIAEAIDNIGDRIRQLVPHAKQIFIEPELAKDS